MPVWLITLFLAFFSGAAALAHELVWTRRLVDIFGASAETFSKVIGAFFLGLAFGAFLGSRQQNSTRTWHKVAMAEFAVAMLALPIVFSMNWLDAGRNHFVFSHFGKLLLPLFLVTPPAIAMGLVIPWMLRATARSQNLPPAGDCCGDSRQTGRFALPLHFATWLYAVNTFGGVFGIFCVLLVALPKFGLTMTGLLVCGMNLCVGAVAWTLSRGKSPEHVETPPSISYTEARYKMLSFFSGFLVLSLEVVVQHQIAQVSINSLFSSGTVLVMVLVSLGLSAVGVSFLKRCWSVERGIAISIIGAAIICAAQPFLLTQLRRGIDILPYELTPLRYTFEMAKLGLVSVLPLFLVTGLLFPWLIEANSSSDEKQVGRKIGTLLAWNGLGGWLGAEITQGWLAATFGLWESVIVIGAAYLILFGAHLMITGARRSRRFDVASPESSAKSQPSIDLKRPEGRAPRSRRNLLIFSGAALTLFCAGFAARKLPQATLLRGERLVEVQVGREGAVATVECGPGDWRMLFNNSYTLGGSKAQFNQARQAHLPILLHGKAKTVAVMGVATGGTVAGASSHSDIESIDAIELSPLVLKFAEKYFGPYNRAIFQNPKVHFFQEDARWVISSHAETYDVVVGDLFLPWRTGEGRLFSLEHFQAVRRALKPDGLYCQWLPLFQLTRPQFESIVHTFKQVFPDACLVRGDFYSDLPILGLLGGRTVHQLNWPQIKEACARLRQNENITDPLVRHVEGVAMLTVGDLPDAPDAPVNTLASAWLEWDAGKNILGMKTPWFIGVPCAEYVRDIHRTAKPILPAGLQAAHDAGQFFLTLDIAAKTKSPMLPNLESQINQRLPQTLREDTSADWQQWPSGVKHLK